jgi:hypothetical protein
VAARLANDPSDRQPVSADSSAAPGADPPEWMRGEVERVQLNRAVLRWPHVPAGGLGRHALRLAVSVTIRLSKGDVQVLASDINECEECNEPATHVVDLDLRAVGMTQCLGLFCKAHADALADRLRASLPDDGPDQE